LVGHVSAIPSRSQHEHATNEGKTNPCLPIAFPGRRADMLAPGRSARDGWGAGRGMAKRGVFCLEGDWWGDLKRPTTVEPMLSLLRSVDTFRVPYIHRNVATRSEFEHLIGRWAQSRHADYPVLYLAFHGEKGALQVGDQRLKDNRVEFDWFEERLASRCRGRIIYFGSCLTLNIHGNRLNSFVERTGALAVCGYRDEVYWMRSTAFDLLFLAELQHVGRWTPAGITNVDRHLRQLCHGLYDELQFRIAVHKP